MALPSQSMSGGGRRSMMSSRRRRRRGGPILFVIFLIAAAAMATWWTWPWTGGAGEETTKVSQRASDPMAETPSRVEYQPSQPAPATQSNPSPVQQDVVTPEVSAVAMPATQTSASSHSESLQEFPKSGINEVADAQAETSPSSVFIEAAAMIRDNDPVAARGLMSRALRDPNTSDAEAVELRGTLSMLGEGMIFGPAVTPGDPFTRIYEIRPGDALSSVVSREGVKTNWRFVQRINGISDPSRIRVGQKIKLVQGPFHAEVDKRDHRIDLWLGEGDEAVYVLSLPVGLGEFDSTPLGAYRVRRGGKMINPSWTNPRTGERFGADDPLNPIGEFWIGLDGIDPHNLQERGFGIHGTIEPDSIGQDRSMGCVRLGDDHIALVYEMLTEGNSTILVRDQ